ncbi:MAG: hypothetical protein ABJH06_16605 [Paraglaciecola sp.]|uniref:hypothetical protein n=1 Tax=Paraglaciecola sp. TaxID=1920173 RepID=UPI003296DE20
MNCNFEKFSSRLMKNLAFSKVNLNKISFDDEVKKIVRCCDPVSGLRSRARLSEMNPKLLDVMLIQSPIICYPFRNTYKLIGGFFTYTQLIVHPYIEPDIDIHIFQLDQKPSSDCCRLFFLQDLTRSLLTEGFVSESRKLKHFLESWFKQDTDKRSIYQSSEWQTIFPDIKTMNDVSEWLHISKKMLS